MKKILFILCCSFWPQTQLSAQTTAIPDANFEQALIDLGIDSDGTINQQVATADVSSVSFLSVSGKSIADLTGIEAFTNLTTLFCNSNQLTALDVSQNSNLIELNCDTNQLTTLDVSNNSNLIKLLCYDNQLTTLDVSNNSNLTTLLCYDNQLTALDIKNGNNTSFTFFLQLIMQISPVSW